MPKSRASEKAGGGHRSGGGKLYIRQPLLLGTRGDLPHLIYSVAPAVLSIWLDALLLWLKSISNGANSYYRYILIRRLISNRGM